MYAKEDFLKSVAVLVAFLVTLSILGALGVTNQVSAQGAYLPPYSIYGTPTPPSNVAVLNSTGEY